MKPFNMTLEQINAELNVLRRSLLAADDNLAILSKADESMYPTSKVEIVFCRLYKVKWEDRISKLKTELRRRTPGLTDGPAKFIMKPVCPVMVEVGQVTQEIIYIEPEVGSYIKTCANPGPGEVENTAVLAVGSRIIKVGN